MVLYDHRTSFPFFPAVRQSLRQKSRSSPGFSVSKNIAPLFSYRYEHFFPYPLSFDIDNKFAGCHPAKITQRGAK